jgi:hypothetical protein
MATIYQWMRGVAKHWFAAVVAFAGAVIAIVGEVFVNFHVPLAVWIGIFAAGFLYAQVAAFHDVVAERDAAIDANVRLDPNIQRIGFKNTLILAAGVTREFDDNAFLGEAERKRWLEEVVAFLAAAVGEGEATALRNAATYTGYVVTLAGGDDARDDVWLDAAARHLEALRQRADTIPLRPDFAPEEWHERISRMT